MYSSKSRTHISFIACSAAPEDMIVSSSICSRDCTEASRSRHGSLHDIQESSHKRGLSNKECCATHALTLSQEFVIPRTNESGGL